MQPPQMEATPCNYSSSSWVCHLTRYIHHLSLSQPLSMYKTWKQRGWAYDEKRMGTASSCVRRRMNFCQFQHRLMRSAKCKKRNANAEGSSTAVKDSSRRGLSFVFVICWSVFFCHTLASVCVCDVLLLSSSFVLHFFLGNIHWIHFFFEDDKFILNCTNSLLTLHYNSNLKITKHRQPQVLSSSWVLFYVVIQAEQVAATVWELNKDRALKPETPPLFHSQSDSKEHVSVLHCKTYHYCQPWLFKRISTGEQY